jgi:pSer/pThr/pTyr-binding forkhead associated (FHA) protein
MASLRLTFPEKEEPTVIALTGARLTIGRLPFNTIQIIDRTVSGFHAELISEHGHYRLHDRGSSNGTFVNGEKVSDFHLSEACTITFGTVEAQFSPEAVAANEEAENFPTRSEINEVRKENVELKATVEVLREEANALRMARPLGNGDLALAVTKEEFDKVVVEREALKEEQLKQNDELARLKTDLAVLKRDRVNLQLAYDGLQREMTDIRAKAGVEETALAPKAAAATLAAQAPAPGEEIRVGVPEPVRPAVAKESLPVAPKPPTPAVEADVAESSPIAPAPVSKPPSFTPSPPKAPSAPGLPAKPFAPLPKAPALAATVVTKPVSTAPSTGAPAVPVKAPVGLGTGIRPMIRPPTSPAAPVAEDAAASPEAPAAGLPPRPSPSVKLPLQPTVKLSAVPSPKIGPKGTQKIA